MDWPYGETYFDDDDLKYVFQYSDIPSGYLRRLDIDEHTKYERLESDEDWENWLGMDPFHLTTEPRPGVGVILASRAQDQKEHNAQILTYLPFSEDTFVKIANRLPIHGEITRIISRSDYAFFSRTWIQLEDGQDVIVYLARSSSALPGDLALAATFYPSTGFTSAMIFGCNDKVVEEIRGRIANSEKSYLHPLLLLGIFAEIEKTRQFRQVDDKHGDLSERIFELSDIDIQELSQQVQLERSKSGMDLWLCMGMLRGELKRWKTELKKMISHCDELDREFYSTGEDATPPKGEDSKKAHERHLWKISCRKSGRRIKERLQEIVDEYDEKIGKCTMLIDGITLATQFSWNQMGYQDLRMNRGIAESNLNIASDTKRDSSHMRSIALLTMVFLPATFVSSLFSMTFFNWQPEVEKGQRVISPWLWIYFVLTVGLTVLVVGIWYLSAVQKEREAADIKAKGKEKNKVVSWEEKSIGDDETLVQG